VAIAEGRTLAFVGPEHIEVGVLESFPYDGPDQDIITETGEFTAVCPYSGLPDFARLTISYVPAGKCVELKSLKYYITSYRSVGIVPALAPSRIAVDLFRCHSAKRLRVRTVYTTRGGFDTTCTDALPTA
jgi:7-cyano-7-deazaguanine reductase